MAAIRLQITADTDGELRLSGLPIQRGETADVLVITPGEEALTDEALIQILTHDPAWAWLKETAEDVYSEVDVRN